MLDIKFSSDHQCILDSLNGRCHHCQVTMKKLFYSNVKNARTLETIDFTHFAELQEFEHFQWNFSKIQEWKEKLYYLFDRGSFVSYSLQKSVSSQFFKTRSKSQPLNISSLISVDYECGNGYGFSQISQSSYKYFLRSDSNKSAFKRWFFFSFKGIAQSLIEILMSKTIREQKGKLNQFKYLTKTDNQSWKVNVAIDCKQDHSHSEEQNQHLRNIKINLLAKGQTIFVSCGIPYGLSNLVRFIEGAEKNLLKDSVIVQNKKGNLLIHNIHNLTYQRSQIGVTNLSLPIYAFEIAFERKLSYNLSNRSKIPFAISKKIIYMFGRVRGGDSSSSLTIEGILEYLLQYFDYENIIFRIVPLLNVDGACIGNSISNLNGEVGDKMVEFEYLRQDLKNTLKHHAHLDMLMQNTMEFHFSEFTSTESDNIIYSYKESNESEFSFSLRSVLNEFLKYSLINRNLEKGNYLENLQKEIGIQHIFKFKIPMIFISGNQEEKMKEIGRSLVEALLTNLVTSSYLNQIQCLNSKLIFLSLEEKIDLRNQIN